MFNSVQYVRDICQAHKIPISQLEKECGFSNGYLNPKKMSKIPYDRAQVIANYLGIDVTEILTGTKPSDSLTSRDQKDIAKDLEALMEKLDSADSLEFDGDPMSDEARESILAAMKLGLEAAKVKNKERFTPNKYRKG